MNLIANWRAVLKHAWSVRFLALSLLFSAIEVAVPFLNGVLPIAPGPFAALAAASTVAAGVARLVVQRKLGNRRSAEPEWETGEPK